MAGRACSRRWPRVRPAGRPLAQPVSLGAASSARRQHAHPRGRLAQPRRQDDRPAAAARGPIADGAADREVENVTQSDFYSYRYFASEGFLPGYSFPRLPLSAFIPARRLKPTGRVPVAAALPGDLRVRARARIVYHEGSRYIINKVILPVGDEASGPGRPDPAGRREAVRGVRLPAPQRRTASGPGPLRALRQRAGARRAASCSACRTSSPGAATASPGTRKSARAGVRNHHRRALRGAGRAPGMSERRGHRAEQQGRWPTGLRPRRPRSGASTWAGATAEAGAGLRARRGARLLARSDEPGEEDDPEDPMSARKERVIPFVEDRRNCLLLEPASGADRGGHGVAAGGAEERHPGALSAGGQRAGGGAAAGRQGPTADPSLRGGRGRRGRAAPARGRPGSPGGGRAGGARHLPLRPGDRRGPAAARPGQRGLRGGLLRLPDDVHQPERPQAAGPPRARATCCWHWPPLLSAPARRNSTAPSTCAS